MSLADSRGVRLVPPDLSMVLAQMRCRACGGPFPEDRIKPRTRWCSRACTAYMADLYRRERNKARLGATRPMWMRVAREAHEERSMGSEQESQAS